MDLGTAAAFREQMSREAGTSLASPSPDPPKTLLLKTDQAPGDAVAMTAAIYSLQKANPGRYRIMVESLWPEVFRYNPDVSVHVKPSDSKLEFTDVAELHMHYPAIHTSNERGIHFMQGWCEFLSLVLDRPVPLLTNRPKLYFDTPEPKVENYWVICSGGKKDFTNKLWGYTRYQWVVSTLKYKVKFVQVGGENDDHPLLDWTENMVGKTTLRGLFDLVRKARGVVCGVSLLMHVAAALDKPAIVIAGGREPVQWNSYPKQHYLHTVGSLPCRSTQGAPGTACWRSRVFPLNDGTTLDRDTCERPLGGVPECMTMISPVEVAELVLRYNRQYEYTPHR